MADITSPRTTRPLCQFYVRNNTCRNNDSCRFSHDLCGMSRTEALKTIPCPFFKKGTCRFGNDCELKHDGASIPPPSPVTAAATTAPQSNEDCCGICLEPCRRFGILSCCNHIFCFECIMEWRTEGSEEVSSRRFCPTCRKESDYVVPSNYLPKSDEEKQEMLRSYKERLAKIPCRNWEGELGSCPFGRDCFYAHLDDDGKDVKSQDRTMHQLYEERQRHRDNRREGIELEMISELIMMGMQRQFFERGSRSRGQRDGRRNRRERSGGDGSDVESEDEMDHFMHSLFHHFMAEHLRFMGQSDSDVDTVEDDDGSESDGSMPSLEDVPGRTHGDDSEGSDMPPLLPNARPPRGEDDGSDVNESDSEREADESEYSSANDDDESMPSLEDMPSRQH